MTTELAVLVLVFAIIALVFAYTVITGASPVPTSPRVRQAMLASLPADLEGTIFELGSGWGTLAFPLARMYPGCRVVAYEISPVAWLFSRLRQSVERLPNLVIERRDFYKASLAEASLAVCYLHSDAMEKLRPKLESELAPGALVLCNSFRVPGWQPEVERTAADMYASKVYLYRIGG